MTAEALTLTTDERALVKTQNAFRTGIRSARRPFGDDGLCDRCRSDGPHSGAVKNGEAGKFVSFETSIQIMLDVDGCHIGSPSTLRSYMANTPRGRANLYSAKRTGKGGRILLDACKTNACALANAGVDVQALLDNIALYDELQAAQTRCTPESLRRLRCDIDALYRESETMARAVWNGAREQETIFDLERAYRALEARMERVYEAFFFDPKRGAFIEPKGRLDRKADRSMNMRRTGTHG